MYWLSKEEIESFREDFQEKEREIQRYIGVYLSGLVLVTGWIIGPQSTPVLKMVLGNDGYNVYAVLVIVSLNVLFTCFLIYKSLIVQEINQFITYQSRPDSGFKYWEKWRRSRWSATKTARPIYTFLLAILPIAVSFLILSGLWKLFHADAQSLIDQLERIESSAAVLAQRAAPSASRLPLNADSLRSVLSTAWIWYWIVVAFHILPLLFFWWNWRPNDKRWEIINRVRGAEVSYEDLEAPKESTSGAKTKVRLLDKATNHSIGDMPERDLQFLIDNLEESSNESNAYYINLETIEGLEQAGASPSLLRVLRKALGNKKEAEIRWVRN